MRLPYAIFVGAMAGLLTLAVPTLARNSSQPKTSEAPPSTSCEAYQQATDGTWTKLPCEEMGSRSPTQPRPASKNADDEAR